MSSTLNSGSLGAGSSCSQGPENLSRFRGAVVLYTSDQSLDRAHERATRIHVAERLAVLTGRKFEGECDGCSPGAYFVPNDTIFGIERAHELGIYDEHDLFGGVVSYPFVATKVITHELRNESAQAPPGWSFEFGRRVRGSVLAGYSAFTLDDARHAGKVLLETGPARVKPARGNGGQGQFVVCTESELDAVLATIDPTELAQYGVLLEENLNEVTTYSVGQIRVMDLLASYYGFQRLTVDAEGNTVYGGSDLVVTRGGFSTLFDLHPPKAACVALKQAQIYDAAANECFVGMFASRRNYDVAQGWNYRGMPCFGVLEQSWRLGGASSAEVAALEALRNNCRLRAVRASCHEVYGEVDEPPAQAIVYFRGVDEQIGAMTKYAIVEPYAYT